MQPLQGEPQFRIHTILAAACHPSMAARHTAASSIPRPLTTGRRQKPPTAVSLSRFFGDGHEGGAQENPATAAAALRPDGTSEGLQRAPRPARGKDAGHRPVALREEAHFLPENGKPVYPARRDGLRTRSAGKNLGHARIHHKCRNP